MGRIADLPLDSLRTCRRCGEVKPLRSFGKNGRKGNWRRYECNRCTWRHRNRTGARGAHGLTDAERTALIASQEGRCAACGMEAELVVDHCHATDRVRAALCTPCNLALGHVKDDPARLRALADYLEEHS